MSNKEELLRLIEAKNRYNSTHKLDTWKPIPQQREFLNCKARRKGLICGNRVGKSDTVMYEVACHATGMYPKDWNGFRFNKKIDVWVVGMSSESLINTVQKKLFGGRWGSTEWGTGFLPLEVLVNKPTMKQGVQDVIKSVSIPNMFGGNSTITFWSRTQDREDFQGDEVNVIAYDEEPPIDIHSECSMRLAAPMSRGEGLALYAFTPLSGETQVWRGLVSNPNAKFFSISMDDVPWLTKEIIEDLLRDCRTDMERRARRNGIPAIGTGQIFQFEENQYACESFEIPPYWPRIGGLDIGKNHPSGAVAIALDRDSGCLYVYQEYKKQPLSIIDLCRPLKHWNVPFATSHDAFNDQLAGNVSKQLKDEGLEIFSAGRNAWARIEKTKRLINDGKLWIFSDKCPHLMEEIRKYSTKEDGVSINKENDDVIDAFTHAVMFHEKASCGVGRPVVPRVKQWEPSSDGIY
jgi:phage terminase large subunit-like protein